MGPELTQSSSSLIKAPILPIWSYIYLVSTSIWNRFSTGFGRLQDDGATVTSLCLAGRLPHAKGQQEERPVLVFLDLRRL